MRTLVSNLKERVSSLTDLLSAADDKSNAQLKVIADQKDALEEANAIIVNTEQEVSGLSEKLWVAQREVQRLKAVASQVGEALSANKEQCLQLETALRSAEKEKADLLLKLEGMSNAVAQSEKVPVRYKDIPPLYTQICDDNKALLRQLIYEINEKRYLQNVVRLLLLSHNEHKKSVTRPDTGGLDPIVAWRDMNQTGQPVLLDIANYHAQACTYQGTAERMLPSVPEQYQVLLDPFDANSMLGHSDQYLKESIRRLRIGWILQKVVPILHRNHFSHTIAASNDGGEMRRSHLSVEYFAEGDSYGVVEVRVKYFEKRKRSV